MNAAPSLDAIRRKLAQALGSQNPEASAAPVRMIGILFAPAGAEVTQTEILPRLDDFHHRSGQNIHFFYAGYGAYWPEGWVADEKVVATTTNAYGNTTNWLYSSKYFNDLLKDVKRLARKWKYSGEVDLLLLNARRGSKEHAELDFSTVVALMINRLKKDGVIETVPELFERIFQYAEAPEGAVTAQGFSDERGVAVGRAWLTDLVGYLPAKAGDLWTKGRHYAVVDLTEA